MANELVQWSKEGQGVNRGHSTPTRHDQKVTSPGHSIVKMLTQQNEERARGRC